MVHIIIPSPGYRQVLQECVDSIERLTETKDYEILLVNTKTVEDDEKEVELAKRYGNIRIHNAGYYHYATINNKAALEWFGDFPEDDYLLFCNDDIEFKTDCVSKMLEVAKSGNDVGTVGALLYFPDGSIQHAGVGLDPKTINCYHIGYKARFEVAPTGEKAVYANTAALMMIKVFNFKRLNGFDEEFQICFEDLDLNLRATKEFGLTNHICYDAVATHKESITRGKELSASDIWRIRSKMADYMYYMVRRSGAK